MDDWVKLKYDIELGVVILARPAKAVAAQSSHLLKKDRNARQALEDKLKGGNAKSITSVEGINDIEKVDKTENIYNINSIDNSRLKPPEFLDGSQSGIFEAVVSGLADSGILGTLDIYVLTMFSIAVDRLQSIEKMINNDPHCLRDKSLMSAKEKYTKDFFRGCNELCLSPQSRAKLSGVIAAAQSDKTDALLAALNING